MKNRTSYGTLRLTAKIVRQLQFPWANVEQPSSSPRFLNFPFSEGAATRSASTTRYLLREKRPLAA
ncbi:MAG: hypothetical protein V4773_05735 [Verrucomicrobiota bacterium]